MTQLRSSKARTTGAVQPRETSEWVKLTARLYSTSGQRTSEGARGKRDKKQSGIPVLPSSLWTSRDEPLWTSCGRAAKSSEEAQTTYTTYTAQRDATPLPPVAVICHFESGNITKKQL